jgi:hypothetical protein
MRRALVGLALCVLSGALLPTASSAQEGRQLVGHWTGIIAETVEGENARYRISVHLDLDRSGRPVAVVSYDLGCAGVWTNAERRGSGWNFEETITEGRDNCASHGEVELVVSGGRLDVRLIPLGQDNIGDGMLDRQPAPQAR